MAYYHHPPHSTTSALSHGAMYSDVQNKPVPGQYFQSPPNPLQHDSPYTQSGTQSLAALQQQQQQQQQHQQQYPGGKARSPAFNGIPEASRGGLTRAGQLQQVPLGPPGPPGQPQQRETKITSSTIFAHILMFVNADRNNQSISAISQPPPSPANPQDLHTFPLQSPGFPQTQQPMASMAVPAAPNPPTQFPIQQYAQSSIAGQQPQSQQSFSNSGPQSQSKTPTNTTPTTQGHSQNPLGGGTGQPPRQILRPPLSPAAAKLETQRISALLDINRALIQEIVLLQAVGKAGVPGQTQGQSSAQVPGGGGSGGSPTGSIAGEGNTEKDGEKLPQQIGSREYVEYVSRVTPLHFTLIHSAPLSLSLSLSPFLSHDQPKNQPPKPQN